MMLIELPAQSGPPEEEVRIGISGNLCRCTGYHNIVAAGYIDAKRLRKSSAAEAGGIATAQ